MENKRLIILLSILALFLALSIFYIPPFIIGTLGMFLVIISAVAVGMPGGLVAAGWSVVLMVFSYYFSPYYLSFAGLASGSLSYLVIGGGLGRVRDLYLEQQLKMKEREERFRQLAESTQAILWEYDISSDRWTYVAPQVAKVLGYLPEEWTNLQFWVDNLHPEDRDWASQYCFECTERGEDHTFEYRFKKKEGGYVWLYDVVTVEMKGGKPFKLRGHMLDITRKKRMEESLLQQKSLLDAALDSLPYPFFLVEADTYKILLANASAKSSYHITGNSTCYGASHDRSEPCSGVGHPCPLVEIERIRQPAKVEHLHYTHDSKPMWVEVHAYPIFDQEGNLHRFIEQQIDITERKEAEEALRESEENLKITLQSIGDGVIATDTRGHITRMNPQAEKLTGWSLEEAKDLSLDQVFHIVNTRNNKRVVNLVSHVINSGETLGLANDTTLISRRGTRYQIADSAAPILNKEGEISGVVIVFSDVTVSYHAREALRESEEKFRVLSEYAPLAIMIYQQDYFVYCNPAAESMSGYSKEELYGMSIWEIVHPDFQELVRERGELRQKGVSISSPYDFKVITKEGEEKWVSLAGANIKYQGESAGLVTLMEITDRKDYEEKLKHMSLYDQLTGLYNRNYFENEINRLKGSREYPVTIISADLDGLKLVNDTVGHKQGDEMLKDCAKILKKSLRCSDIIARIGGDEFVSILPRTDRETAGRIAKRIKTNVEVYNLQENNKIPLSLSLGLATAVDSSKDLEEAFKESDDLMYRDKLFKGAGARSQIIKSLMATLKERDFATENHAQRMQNLCLKMGKKLKLSEKRLSDLALLAHVHDLGKLGVPDRILFKEGPLTPEEWKVMRQHSEKGHRIALSSKDLSGIAELILKHHERWDGKGYPLNLKGENIPLECRILAVVDAYDAMTSDRPYRKALSKEEAIKELRCCAGSQFDPELVEIFITLLLEDNPGNHGDDPLE